MKQENDSIDRIFRSRLNESGMPVRKDFWDDLTRDLPQAKPRNTLLILRFSAAASILILLMGASAALWYFSPKEEIVDALRQVTVSTGSTTVQDADMVYKGLPVFQSSAPSAVPSGMKPAKPMSSGEDEDEQITVSISMSISYSSTYNTASDVHTQTTSSYQHTSIVEGNELTAETQVVHDGSTSTKNTSRIRHPWSLGVFTSMGLLHDHSGVDTHHRPFSLGISLQKQLSPHIAFESGLVYTQLKSDLFDPESALAQEQTLHYIGLPIKANIALYERDKLNLYTSLGGMVEVCTSAKNASVPDPLQLSLNASLGMQYKLSDYLSLYAEPGLSYHFDDGASTSSIRKDKPLNLNILCGLRMAF